MINDVDRTDGCYVMSCQMELYTHYVDTLLLNTVTYVNVNVAFWSKLTEAETNAYQYGDTGYVDILATYLYT
jgi:hypothetical protein